MAVMRPSLVAAAGGLFRLGRVLPRNVAMECALTGEPLGAERAHARIERGRGILRFAPAFLDRS